MSTDIKERIVTEIGNLFVSEWMVKPYVVTIDSALLKSKDHVVCMHHPCKNELYIDQGLIQIQGGALVIPKEEYVDTNYIWYVVLIL